MRKTYVISGVTGMTGNEFARQIISTSDDRVIGFDNFFASSLQAIDDFVDNERFKFYNYDLNNIYQMNLVKDVVLQQDSSEIIYVNCAAVVHTEYFYHIQDTYETNVMGMKKFLQQAIEVDADVFINCSTSEVYSMQSYKEGGVSEDDYILLATAEHSQRTSYASGKLMTEFFLKDAVLSGKISGCSIRFANVYSRNELFPKHIIPHIITSLANDNKIRLLHNAKKTQRTFLHNTDSCAAVMCLINQKDALDGSVYNVGTQEEVSILHLVDMIANKMGIKEPEIIFEGFRESDPEQRVLCTDKIYKKTGWSPSITLEEGITQCINFYEGRK